MGRADGFERYHSFRQMCQSSRPMGYSLEQHFKFGIFFVVWHYKKDSSMKRTNFYTRSSHSPKSRFLIEIGISILIAFAVFQSVSFWGKMDDGKKDLTELEESLDELEAVYFSVEEKDPTRENLEVVQLRMELIAFHEIWLEGLAQNKSLPWKELRALRRKIDLMKGEEENRLELLREIQVLRKKADELEREARKNSREAGANFEESNFDLNSDFEIFEGEGFESDFEEAFEENF